MEKDTAVLIVKVYAVLSWIGALLLLFGALWATGLSSFGALSMMGGRNMMAGTAFAGLWVFFGVLMLALAAFEVIVGWGLWTFKPWARIAAIVLSVLDLFSFPIGTVMGAFGIWFFGFEESTKSLFGASDVTAKKKR